MMKAVAVVGLLALGVKFLPPRWFMRAYKPLKLSERIEMFRELDDDAKLRLEAQMSIQARPGNYLERLGGPITGKPHDRLKELVPSLDRAICMACDGVIGSLDEHLDEHLDELSSALLLKEVLMHLCLPKYYPHPWTAEPTTYNHPEILTRHAIYAFVSGTSSKSNMMKQVRRCRELCAE